MAVALFPHVAKHQDRFYVYLVIVGCVVLCLVLLYRNLLCRICLGAGLLLLTALGVFLWGSTQWHRQIYIVRAYRYPGTIARLKAQPFECAVGLHRMLRDHGLSPDEHYTGVWRTWHPNSQAESEQRFEDGREEGEFTMWYASGKKEAQGAYRNGKREGIMTCWYESGKRLSVRSCEQDMLHGAYEGWHEDGTPQWRGSYKKGSGVRIDWDTQGKVIDITYSLDGFGVTGVEYLAACAKDATLPKPSGNGAQPEAVQSPKNEPNER